MRIATDFHPCVERARYLVFSMHGKLKESLHYLLQLSASQYSIDTQRALQKIEEHFSQHQQSGFIFILNQKLLKSLQNENVEDIRAVVKEIEECHYIVPSLSIRNFATDSQREKQEHWISEFICFDAGCYPVPKKCSSEQFAYTKAELEKGLCVLRTVDEKLYEELSCFVREILIFDSDTMRSGSSFDFFGSVYFKYLTKEKDWLHILEDLVHEAAHLYLFSLVSDDPLVLNKFEKIYDAPFRPDKRPLIGIYHGVFVVGRILLFLHKFKDSNHPLLQDYIDRVESLIQKFHIEFTKGMTVIETDGILTPLAKELIKNTKEKVSLMQESMLVRA